MNYKVALKLIEFLAGNRNLVNIATLAKTIEENSVTTQRTIKDLVESGIITANPFGNSHIIYLNKTAQVLGFLTLAVSFKQNNPDQIMKDARDLYDQIPEGGKR